MKVYAKDGADGLKIHRDALQVIYGIEKKENSTENEVEQPRLIEGLEVEKQKEEKKQEQKIQSEPQIVMNPVNNVNVWNCFIPFYPMNYQIINNINNIYYTNSTQGNIQEKGVDCNMMMQSTSANYSNQMWNYN